MAAITQTEGYGRSTIHTWALTTADPTGDALNSPGNPDRAVQVSGTFGGATMTLQGSCQATPTVWATLHDPSGADLAFTAAGLKAVLENPTHIRANLTAVGVGASIAVNMVSRSV